MLVNRMPEPAWVKILIVDDLPEKHLVYRAVLEEPGQEIVSALSGEEALKALLQDDFAVILLDVNMPGMDGFETAALIRTHKRCALTPIIFITMFTDELYAVKGYSYGAVDYILGPVHPEILRTKVSVFVQLFRLNRLVKEQAAAQVDLAQTEQARLAEVLENATDLVGRADAQGRVRHVNRAGRKMLGLDNDAAIETLQPPLQLPDEGLRAARRDGVWFGESVLQDHKKTPVAQIILAHKNAHGEVESFSMVARDISERKRGEEALQRSEVRFRSIIDSALDAVVTIDAAGIVTGWTAQAEAVFGWRREEIVGQLLSSTIIPLPYRQAHQEGLERFKETGSGPVLNRRIEFSAVHRDGHEFPVELSITPISVGDTYGFSAFIRDITERKRAEAANARLVAIVESSEDAIVSKDLNGVIITWNHGAERLFGYSAKEVVGRPITVLIPDGYRHEETEILARIRRGEATEHYETIRRRKDGHLLNISLTVSPLRDGQGNIIGASKIARDVSDRKRSEEAIARLAAERAQLLESEREARAEAERLGTAKDEFLANLSHELRTPLNAILLWVHLLQSPKASPEEIAEGLAVVARNARVQAQLVADLLEMNRIVSGKVRLDLETVDICRIISEAVETIGPIAADKKIRLTATLPDQSVSAVADGTRVQQVIGNLLTNAIKFTPNGGSVEVSLTTPDTEMAAIEIRDTGMGIDPEFIPHLFDRFRQADVGSTRRFGGLGLGLAIVKHLVGLHGGTVSAHSAGNGQGSTFTVRIPRRAHLASQPRKRAAPSLPSEADLARNERIRGLRVLVVDDQPDAADLVKRVLEEHEVQVTVAHSAAEAFAQVQHDRPEVMISDIGMPIEDGYSLIRRIRKTEDGNEPLRAIALTAFARPEDARRAAEAGYHAHIAKPLDPAELIRVVGSQLDPVSVIPKNKRN